MKPMGGERLIKKVYGSEVEVERLEAALHFGRWIWLSVACKAKLMETFVAKA